MENGYISKALKSVRQYYRLTQAELAADLGLSKSAISDIETGNKPISLNTVERYADWAGVAVSDIFVLAEAYRRRDVRTGPADLVLRVYEWFNAERSGKAKSKSKSKPTGSDDDSAGPGTGNGSSLRSESAPPSAERAVATVRGARAGEVLEC